MDNVVSRFLTFEETLGRGLVKFAYFVLLIGLVVWAVIEVIGGVVLLFDRPLAGLWEIVHTPFEFLLWVILLRVATELVLAVLSIDDNLTENAIAGRDTRAGLAAPRGGFEATRTPSVTTPVADAPASDASDASAPEAATSAKADTNAGSAAASAASSTTSAARPATKAAGRTTKAPARKTTKKTAKKTAKSSPSTRATVKAANESAASARSDETPRGGDEAGEKT